jgi:hypothetical protein
LALLQEKEAKNHASIIRKKLRLSAKNIEGRASILAKASEYS